MTATAELVGRLRGLVDTGRRTVGGGSVSFGDDGKRVEAPTWGNEPIMALRNPDGPEAATTIETLAAALAEARDKMGLHEALMLEFRQTSILAESRAAAAEEERDRYKAAHQEIIDEDAKNPPDLGLLRQDNSTGQMGGIRWAACISRQALSRDGGGDGAS